MSEARGSLKEPLLAFAVATALAAACAAVGALVPLVRDYLHVLIAVIFFQTPVVAAQRAGRDLDYRDIGLRADPVRLNLAMLGAAMLITFPGFVAGFFVFYGRVCATPNTAFARMFAPNCYQWLGWAHGHLHLPSRAAVVILSQLVVVAIPEELFFRGYLMERLERVWPPTRRIAGAKVGWALIVSSALFALGHVAVIPNPQRLAVFFPALLFGWMRARTGSIAAGAAFHALCNVLAEVLHTSYFS